MVFADTHTHTTAAHIPLHTHPNTSSVTWQSLERLETHVEGLVGQQRRRGERAWHTLHEPNVLHALGHRERRYTVIPLEHTLALHRVTFCRETEGDGFQDEANIIILHVSKIRWREQSYEHKEALICISESQTHTVSQFSLLSLRYQCSWKDDTSRFRNRDLIERRRARKKDEHVVRCL